MGRVFAFLVALLLSIAYSDASSILIEKIENPPREWHFLREADLDSDIELQIFLKEQNTRAFEQHVLHVSTPGHSQYGRHLEREDVNSWLEPPFSSRRAVIDWLNDFQVYSIIDGRDFIGFKTSMSVATALLNTTFASYRHDSLGEIVRTLHYAVPEHIAEVIDFVNPTTRFPSEHKIRHDLWTRGMQFIPANVELDAAEVTTANYSACNQDKGLIPECLLRKYKVHYGPDPNNGNRLAIASFFGQHARFSDLDKFETLFAPYAKATNMTDIPLTNITGEEPYDLTEANIDSQWTIGLSYPVPVTEYLTGGCGPLIPDPYDKYSHAGPCANEPYINFLKNLLAMPNERLPQTLSISYGEDEQTWPRPLAEKACRMFAQLAARGVSVLVASGDYGTGVICENTDSSKQVFMPVFPATCPFVTAVGATKGIAREEATYFSSGGFSDYFPRPSWQDSQVKAYLGKLGDKQSQYYNHTGRGFPDVAANGFNWVIVNRNQSGHGYQGTSCSTPAFASIISLLNSALISNGRRSLGFLNPWLYSTGFNGLTDVTKGGSSGCAIGHTTIPYASWNATAGWDPVTGLGTPDFEKLLMLVSPGTKNAGGIIPQ